MPKLKSKGAVKKRFRISKSGKALCSHPGRGHMHAIYSGKVRRNLRRRLVIEGQEAVNIRRMLGGA